VKEFRRLVKPFRHNTIDCDEQTDRRTVVRHITLVYSIAG